MRRRLAIALVGLAAASTRVQAQTTLSIEPAQLVAPPAATVEIEVRVSAAQQIGALQFTLDFDSTVARFQFVRIGGDLQAQGFGLSNVTSNLPWPPVTQGTNAHVAVQMHGGGAHWFTGSNLQAAVMTFVVGTGWCSQSTLAFDPTCSHTQLVTYQLATICAPQLQLANGSLAERCIAAAPAPAPRQVRLLPNAPNPFNPATRILFEILLPTRVEIEILRADGRRVRLLAAGDMEAGLHVIPWNGQDAAGHPLPSGVYFCRLRTPAGALARSMQLVR